jgi:hypothetical protein
MVSEAAGSSGSSSDARQQGTAVELGGMQAAAGHAVQSSPPSSARASGLTQSRDCARGMAGFMPHCA